MKTDLEIQEIINGTYKLKVGDKFTVGNNKKVITVISETEKFIILDICFDGGDKNIRVRKEDGRVMGGVINGQIYI
jgi:hypothetical protein